MIRGGSLGVRGRSLRSREAFAALIRCAHGGQPSEYERSVSYPQNVMPGIALPQNRSKSDSDQPDSGLETADFERKMAQPEIVIRLGRG